MRSFLRVGLVAILAAVPTSLVPPTSPVLASAIPEPILHLALDDGGGLTATDSAPGGHDATLSGPTWISGQSGGALRFGGDGDRADIAGDGIHHLDGETISMWVRSGATAPANGAVVFEAGGNGCEEPTFGLYAADHGVRFTSRAYGPFASDLTTDPSQYGIDVWDGDWHHVAATANAFGHMRIAIDAFELGGAGGSIDYASETDPGISLGASLGDGGCGHPSFAGDIDDVRIYPRVLDRDEIATMLPPVGATVTLSQSEAVYPRRFAGCLVATVAPAPPAGSVRVELRDDAGNLAGASYFGGCLGFVPPPAGVFPISLNVPWAGTYSAVAFFEPGLPWLPAQSEPVTITISRLPVSAQLVVPNVMPGQPIHADAVIGFTDTDDRGGAVSLVDTTGGGEVVIATAPVVPVASSMMGVASFDLSGRDVGDYTFEARYSGTANLWQSATATAGADIDDTLGSRGPVTFGLSPTYWTSDVLDVYAPADHAQYVEVREPGGQWFRQGYHLPVIYPLNTFADTPRDGPITIQVRWIDDGSRTSEIQQTTLTLDRTAPRVDAAGTGLRASAVSAGTVPARVRWSAADTTSGVASTTVQLSRNGKAYRTVAAAAHGSGIDQRLSTGDRFRYRLRTTDVAGNTSAWAYDRTVRPSAYSESAGIVRYSGSWTTRRSDGYLGDRARSTTSKGAKATVTFKGRSFAWVGSVGPTRGKAAIYINGKRYATVDLSAPSIADRRVVFTKTWSRSRSRKVEIRALGTVGRPRIDVDGILIVR